MREASINLVAEETQVDGRITVTGASRIHGVVKGQLDGAPGSSITLAETGVVEGEINGDRITIDGYVRGNVRATTQAVVSATGRVVGDIEAPSVIIEFGAHFEGECRMENLPQRPVVTAAPSEQPA